MRKQNTLNHYPLLLALILLALVISTCFTTNSVSARALSNTLLATANINDITATSNIKFAKNIPAHKQAQFKEWVIHTRPALRLVYGKLPFEDVITLIKAST